MSEQIYWDDVEEGQEFNLIEPMDSQRLVIWAAASGDFYQIHYARHHRTWCIKGYACWKTSRRMER